MKFRTKCNCVLFLFFVFVTFALEVKGQSPSFSGPLPRSSCKTKVPWSDENCHIGPFSIGTDIAPKVFRQLCPVARGRNEAPTSCDLYITCHDEHLTVNRCPAQSHFHPIEKECVDSHLFECSYPVIRDPSILLQERESTPRESRQASLHWQYGNSDPFTSKQSPDWKSEYCQDGEEGIFKHPESCEYFIQCTPQGLLEQKCPAGSAFNSRLSVCDYKENVKCRSRVKRNAIISNLDSLKPSGSRALPVHKIQKRNACPIEFVTPHPQFCDKFQVCSHGRLHTQSCAEGTLFDPLKKVCSSPEGVQCGARLRDFATYECLSGMKYSTLHPDDCHKFIECEDGQIHVKSCPGKLIFNPEKGLCDYSYKTVCKALISLEHDIDINYLPGTHRRHGRDLSKYECEFNYIAPLDGTCNNFIECENKRLFKKSCGPGTAYNPLLGQCDWPYKVTAPDPQYCQRYLQCDGRKFVPTNCPHNSYYNSETGKCDSIEKVNCAGKADDPRRKDQYLQSK